MIWIIGAIVVFFMVRNKQLTLSSVGKALGGILIFVGLVGGLGRPGIGSQDSVYVGFKVGEVVEPKAFDSPATFEFCIPVTANAEFPPNTRAGFPELATQFSPFKIVALGEPLTVMSLKTGQIGTIANEDVKKGGFALALWAPAPKPNDCTPGFEEGHRR